MRIFDAVRKWWTSGSTVVIDAPAVIIDVKPAVPVAPPVKAPGPPSPEIASLIEEIDLAFNEILDYEEHTANEHAADPRWQSGRTNVGVDEGAAVHIARNIDRSALLSFSKRTGVATTG